MLKVIFLWALVLGYVMELWAQPSSRGQQGRDVRKSLMCLAGPLSRMPPDETLDHIEEAAKVLEADVLALLLHNNLRPKLDSKLARRLWMKPILYWDLRTRESRRAVPGANVTAVLRMFSQLLPGNLLTPLHHRHYVGRSAFQLQTLWLCRATLLREEALRGSDYQFWIYHRFDFHWLAPPPPLSLLQLTKADAIWVPEGQDWDGLNDRFALVPRNLADLYFGAYARLLNGSLASGLRRLSPHLYLERRTPLHLGVVGKAFHGPEWGRLAILALHGVRAARFSSVAAIARSDINLTDCPQLSRSVLKSNGSSLASPLPYKCIKHFKYPAEIRQAFANALHIWKSNDWQWTASDWQPRMRPHCFQESWQSPARCCAKPHLPMGDIQCWEKGGGLTGKQMSPTDVGLYDNQRCCGSLGVYVLPTPSLARLLLEVRFVPFCFILDNLHSFRAKRCLNEDELLQLSAASPDQAAMPSASLLVSTPTSSVSAAHAGAELSASQTLSKPSRRRGGLCQASSASCRWNFVRYTPSSLEEAWWQSVDEYGPPGKDVCESANGKFKKWFQTYIDACGNPAMTVTDKGPFHPCNCSNHKTSTSRVFDPNVFSRFEYVNECTKEVRHSYIEPLAGILRHPSGCKDLWLNVLRKDWLVLDQWSIHRNLGAESKYYYFDAGASTWKEGAGGASQSWFEATYWTKCVKFDGFWMWEVTPHDAQEVFAQVPAEAVPNYHWFNAPAEINATAKMSPLFHIKSVADEDDFVMFKLDIDDTYVEEGIVDEILKDETLQGLIDEFFWEHHINMPPMTTPYFWDLPDERVSVGQRKSIGRFRKLRERGIRAHSWV